MVIRPAIKSDYERYAQLIIQLTQLHKDMLPNIFTIPAGVPNREWFDPFMDNDQKLLILAEADNQILGILEAEIKDTGTELNSILKPRKILHIADMLVEKNSHHQGIGKALIIYAEEWGKSKDAIGAELSVYAFNQGANLFYEKIGFKPLKIVMEKEI